MDKENGRIRQAHDKKALWIHQCGSHTKARDNGLALRQQNKSRKSRVYLKNIYENPQKTKQIPLSALQCKRIADEA